MFVLLSPCLGRTPSVVLVDDLNHTAPVSDLLRGHGILSGPIPLACAGSSHKHWQSPAKPSLRLL